MAPLALSIKSGQVQGTIDEIRGHLEAALNEGTLSVEIQFWALDTLAFFDIEIRSVENVARRLPEMKSLADQLGDDATQSVLHKQVLVACLRGDLATARHFVVAGSATPKESRILKYHLAQAEAEAGNVRDAITQFLSTAEEYLSELGLTQTLVFGREPAELQMLMRDDVDIEDIRHLADCYYAIVLVAREHPEYKNDWLLSALWSMTFYDLAHASRSLLRAGQEVVDARLACGHDPCAIRTFVEQSLLPTVERARLSDMVVPIRSQYAVICAYCDDFHTADSVLEALDPYLDGLPTEGRAELQNQQRLVEQLRLRRPPIVRESTDQREWIEAQNQLAERQRVALDRRPRTTQPVSAIKVGRNERCPCGSGKKYKKCCGASR